MNLDADGTCRRIPTLVQLCQRVCASSIDSISSLGDGIRYELVRPILERCDAEQLFRLEDTSPHLVIDTQDIWRDLCFSCFPLAIERYTRGPEEDLRTWKEHYFFLREAEAKRLEEASAKLRNQRLVAEERKKEREVKITDRLPPPKRQRTGWASNPAPKTLFQKTRSDASKLQRNLYTRIVPPMPPKGKRAAILPKPSISNLEFLPTTTGTSRVTVTNVVRRRPGISPSTSSTASTSTLASPSNLVQATSSGSSSLVTNLPPPVAKPHCLTAPSQSATGATQSPTKPPFRADVSAPPQPRPLKPPSQKKDPMASLFVPKRRAYSQLP